MKRSAWVATAITGASCAIALAISVRAEIRASRTETLARATRRACEDRSNRSAAEIAAVLQAAQRLYGECEARMGEICRSHEASLAEHDDLRRSIETPVAELRAELAGLARALEDSRNADADRRMRIESLLADAQRRLRSVEDQVSPDPDRLRQATILPTVHVNGHDTVGGGTIIRVDPNGASQDVYILTAYHVIQRAVRPADPKGIRVQVTLYDPEGRVRETREAEILAYHDKQDVALLRIRTEGPPPRAARLASREHLRAVRVFDPVLAVGCPLGHDPMPSAGIVSNLRKQVGGESFWIVSAPTIFGNSGGGIYDRRTLELIGVSALICTYDAPVSTPVPHMSIVVPLEAVYDWLDSLGLSRLYAPESATAPAAAITD